jgi:hypothetical protein
MAITVEDLTVAVDTPPHSALQKLLSAYASNPASVSYVSSYDRIPTHALMHAILDRVVAASTPDSTRLLFVRVLKVLGRFHPQAFASHSAERHKLFDSLGVLPLSTFFEDSAALMSNLCVLDPIYIRSLVHQRAVIEYAQRVFLNPALRSQKMHVVASYILFIVASTEQVADIVSSWNWDAMFELSAHLDACMPQSQENYWKIVHGALHHGYISQVPASLVSRVLSLVNVDAKYAQVLGTVVELPIESVNESHEMALAKRLAELLSRFLESGESSPAFLAVCAGLRKFASHSQQVRDMLADRMDAQPTLPQIVRPFFCHPEFTVKMAIAELFFAVCEEDVPRFLGIVGMGNAAGYLAARGIIETEQEDQGNEDSHGDGTGSRRQRELQPETDEQHPRMRYGLMSAESDRTSEGETGSDSGAAYGSELGNDRPES